jgi:polyisoprenoid-binding protein YceI
MQKPDLSSDQIMPGEYYETTAWSINYNASYVRFLIAQHNLVGKPFRKIQGKFRVYAGFLGTNMEDFTDADINFSIVVNSINTGNDKRDKALKSPAFLNVAKFPLIRFKSVAFVRERNNNYILEGDCTIRGITKRVVFDVVHEGKKRDRSNDITAGFKVRGKINRHDFGLRGNLLQDIFIGKEITILLNLEFAQEW